MNKLSKLEQEVADSILNKAKSEASKVEFYLSLMKAVTLRVKIETPEPKKP